LMIIVTLGLYRIYWNCAAAKRLNSLGAKDRSMFYLIVSIIAHIPTYVVMALSIINLLGGDIGVHPALTVVAAISGIAPYLIFASMMRDAGKLKLNLRHENTV